MDLKSFNEITLEELKEINGGKQSDYNFGHKVGTVVREIVWDPIWNFIGPGTPVY